MPPQAKPAAPIPPERLKSYVQPKPEKIKPVKAKPVKPPKPTPPPRPSPATERLTRERLLILARAKEELARREARAEHAAPGGLVTFVRYFWKVLEPVTPFVEGWCLEGMCEHLEAVSRGEIKRLLMNVSPGFMKSLLLNVFWPAFEWGPMNRPDLRYVAFSYSSILTERDNEKFLYLIQSPEYQALYGKRVIVTKEGVGRVSNSARGWKFASSVGGVGTGERGDRILCLPFESRILTDRGELPIGEIVSQRLAVRVAGVNQASGAVEWQDIERFQANPGARLVRLVHDRGELRCTAEHPVYVVGRGFAPASEARVGERLRFLRQDVQAQDQPSAEDVLEGVRQRRVDETQARRQHQAVRRVWDACLSAAGAYAALRERLLQPRLSRNPQRRIEQPGVSDRTCRQGLCQLWQSVSVQVGRINSAAGRVLLASMRRRAYEIPHQFARTVSESVQTLRQNISAEDIRGSVLFAPLRRCAAFGSSVGRWQWPLRARAGVPQISEGMAEGPQAKDPSARRLRLHGLCQTGDEASAARSPYRLRQGEFVGGQFDHAVQILPRQDARRLGVTGEMEDSVIHAVVAGDVVSETFNLSVTPHHNYFANGVLMHNCDDAHKVSEAESELVREDTTRWFRESMQNRLNDLAEGVIIVLGQRVHEADVSGVVIDEYPDYEHFCVPMEYDGRDILDGGEKRQTCIGWEDPRWNDGELAWPERYPLKVLESFKARQYLWSGQYQQAPSPRGGGIIKYDYWQVWNQAAQAANDVKPGMYPIFEFVLASFDGAFTEDKANDYSALTVWGAWIETNEETRFNEHFGTPRLMLMHAWHKRLTLHGRETRQGPHESKAEFEDRQKSNWGVVEWIAYDCTRLKVDKLIIENKATGHTVEQEMRRLFSDRSFTVALHDPGRQDKTARAYMVEHLFADGLIWAPGYNDGRFVDWADLVVDELAKLPKGAHDDLADSSVNAIIHLRRMALAPRKDESHAVFEEQMWPSTPPRRLLHYET